MQQRPFSRSAISLPFAFALALFLLAAFALPASADGIIIPRPPVNHPQPVPWRDIPLTVKYHRVDVTINDQVATTQVDQVFVNEAAYPVEGTYMFPLPEDAAISDFEMTVDGQKLEGKLLGREEARAIYENIVRTQRDPALLEYVGRGAFQASIFPIPAGAERRVELTYSQVLARANNLVHYRYPLNTEKFSARPLGEVAVTVKIQDKSPLRAVYSPGYPIDVTRDGDRKATLSYEAQNVRPDRDFDLYYSLSSDAIAVNLLSYKPATDDGFFLLLVTPPVTVTENSVAKDVILVMDTSGSMQGPKLEQARLAGEFVLNHLGKADRFNIISFSSAVHALAQSPVPASRLKDGLAFIEGLSAQGSTDINRALLEATAGADRERPTILIFLTDGQPTMGEIDPDRIVANVTASVPKTVRLFAFGVGYDVDTVLLDQLSSELRGASAYVKPGESIDETVSAFYEKVSEPVLVDAALTFDRTVVEDIYPYPLPDLFAGSQLVVAGRYPTGGPAKLKLTGSVNGEPRSFEYTDLALATNGGDDFIAPLWAQRKIGYLLAQIRLHGAQEELIKEVVALSTRYGIVTPYTSFLVQEPQLALSEAGRDHIVQGLQAPTGTAAAGGGAASAPAAPANDLAGATRAGEKAVARAEVEKQLQSNSYAAPAAQAATGQSKGTATDIRQVGDRTFVLSEGTWLDTQFDTDKMKAEAIAFGSERYFQLLAEHPEVGPSLALGDRVTLVLNGKAYAVGPNGQTAEQPGASGETASTPSAQPTSSATKQPRATPAVVAAVPAKPTGGAQPGAAPGQISVGVPPCAGGLVLGLMGIGMPVWMTRRSRRR